MAETKESPKRRPKTPKLDSKMDFSIRKLSKPRIDFSLLQEVLLPKPMLTTKSFADSIEDEWAPAKIKSKAKFDTVVPGKHYKFTSGDLK